MSFSTPASHTFCAPPANVRGDPGLHKGLTQGRFQGKSRVRNERAESMEVPLPKDLGSEGCQARTLYDTGTLYNTRTLYTILEPYIPKSKHLNCGRPCKCRQTGSQQLRGLAKNRPGTESCRLASNPREFPSNTSQGLIQGCHAR